MAMVAEVKCCHYYRYTIICLIHARLPCYK